MTPPLFDGVTPFEFCDEIWHQKTRIVELPDSEEIMSLPFFVLTQYRRVTDRRTDGRTRCCRKDPRRAGNKCKHKGRLVESREKICNYPGIPGGPPVAAVSGRALLVVLLIYWSTDSRVVSVGGPIWGGLVQFPVRLCLELLCASNSF